VAVRWAIKNKVLHTLAHSLSYDHNEHVVASIALLVQQRNSFHLTRFRHPSSRGSISLATRCVVDPPRALRVAILQRNIGGFVCQACHTSVETLNHLWRPSTFGNKNTYICGDTRPQTVHSKTLPCRSAIQACRLAKLASLAACVLSHRQAVSQSCASRRQLCNDSMFITAAYPYFHAWLLYNQIFVQGINFSQLQGGEGSLQALQGKVTVFTVIQQAHGTLTRLNRQEIDWLHGRSS